MLKLNLLALVVAILPIGSSAVTRDVAGNCIYGFASQPGTPEFETYASEDFVRQPKPPLIVNAETRRYRTAIRGGAEAGVNFASRYTIVGWGCGSSCLDWAIVDRATGAVHFDPRYRVVSTVHVADQPVRSGTDVDRTFNGLRFRRDSNLLVIQGAPNEDVRQEGLTFLEWSGRDLRRIGFVPAAQLCA